MRNRRGPKTYPCGNLFDIFTHLDSNLLLFMQGIFTYIPETNYISREYSVAAIPFFLFMVHTLLARIIIVVVVISTR